MATKLLENLNLKDERKQIGCMTGFIHLFDPNQAVLPKPITNLISLESLQDNSQLFRGSCDAEQTPDPHLQYGLEMRSNRNSNDRHGMYTESSKASCSSSPSSSFSSPDFGKVMHQDPSSYDRIFFPESPLLDRSLSHSGSSWRMRQRSFDLDDAVKGLTCGIVGGEESMLSKYKDSLRPSQRIELSTASLNAFSEHKGSSTRAPIKVKDSLCFFNDDIKTSRRLDKSKGSPYARTESESNCYRDETKEAEKNCGMLDELARLSVDSSTECSVPNSGMRIMHLNQRPPSIIEKLMGLEAMPGASYITQNGSNRFAKYGERQDTNMINESASQATTACMPIQVSNTQRCSRKDHKWKNGELIMRPISSSKIIIEPAPWKQPAVKSKQGSACEANGFTALYSKFEGRLKDIEFQRSSKDPKALKQMLDAIQQNRSWRVENKVLSNGVTMNYNSYLDMTKKTVQQNAHQNACISVANGEHESCAKTLKSPIVVMKPYRLVAKSDIADPNVIYSEGTRHLLNPQVGDSAARRKALSNTQTVQGQNPQNGYRSPRISPSEKKLTHKQPTMHHSLLKEKKTMSSVSAGSPRPRMQQNKFEIEKKPRPVTTSHDSTKLSMPKSKHPRKSCTLGENFQLKHSFIQQCNAHSSGFSIESKDAHCGDDTEVTSKLRLNHLDGSCSPAMKVARPMFSGIRKHKPNRISTENTPMAHPATVAAEQPSPVSVLDSSAYRDDPPSPLIRKTACGGTAEVVTDMSREKLKQIQELVYKLNGVGSTYDNESSTDFIASLCKTTNPDQRYISKILVASGFLFRDFESSGNTFQPHFSGYPINPELFSVLEQTKSSTLLTGDRNKFSASKSHRRLIFDSCNEILSELLIPSDVSNELGQMPRKLARRKITAPRLLKDTCDRIEQLQANNARKGKVEQEEGQDEDNGIKIIVYADMMLKSDKWATSKKCMAEVVLDIERMLFKDLVKEIVSDEAVSCALRSKAGRSCDRKLKFNKI